MADANKMEGMADLHKWFAKQMKRMVRSNLKNTFSIWIILLSCLLATNFDILNTTDKKDGKIKFGADFFNLDT